MFVDSHTHLGSHQFDSDLEAVLDRARAAGVGAMMAPATDLENARKLLGIAAANADVFVAVGVHPCDADSVKEGGWIDELRALACHPKVVAVGEIGLDYYHQPPAGFDWNSWKAHQHHCLRLQLDLAAELGLNVVLHNRESWDDLIAIVAPYAGRLRAVFHCFTGTPDQARPLVEAGHLVSFTGIVTFKNPGPAAETARMLDDGTFMLETDSPYLAPVPHRGKRCEPAFVVDTARAIASMRGQSFEDLAARTTATASEFFKGLRLRPTC